MGFDDPLTRLWQEERHNATKVYHLIHILSFMSYFFSEKRNIYSYHVVVKIYKMIRTIPLFSKLQKNYSKLRLQLFQWRSSPNIFYFFFLHLLKANLGPCPIQGQNVKSAKISKIRHFALCDTTATSKQLVSSFFTWVSDCDNFNYRY